MCRRAIGVCMIIAFLLCDKATAQQYAYRVDFTDKNNTPYHLSNPLMFLSPRAIARRTTQGIVIDSADIPVNHNYLDSVINLTGGIIHESSRWLNLCVVLLSDSTLIHALDGKPFIKSSKLVGYYSSFLHHKPVRGTTSPKSASKTTTSDDFYFGYAWGQTQIVNGFFLHDKGYDGSGKLIAVLDAGFTGTDTLPGFDSLWAAGRVLDTHNFKYNTSYVFAYDDHGTKALSTMAAYTPNLYVGSAPLASYVLYVTEDDNSEQPIELINMLCGTERADSVGADIVSSSLGYDTFDNPADNFTFISDFDGISTVAAQAANMATRKGMLFVTSAGNEGGGPWNRILTPGDADSALTIGSVEGLTGAVWPSSGVGPNAAGQIKPDVCGQGHVAAVYSPAGYTSEDGTSFSTPQIAGWAACLWQANPMATPYQLRQAIIRCASSYSTPGPQIGYGIPNFHCAEQVLGIKTTPPPFTASNWIIASPNPFNGEITLSVYPDSDNNISFKLIDMTGKTFASNTAYFYKGYNSSVTLSVPGLPSGIYILKAVSPTQQKVIKLEKP